jgi:hypothetical protein
MFLRFIAFALAYLLFAGQASLAECGMAVLCGLAATWLSLALRRRAKRPFRFASMPWRPFLGLPATMLRESARVGAALARALLPGSAPAGSTAPQPFQPGGEAAEEHARRALVVLGLSMAPNGFVLDDQPDGGSALLVHRLVPQAPATDRRWPL